MYKPQEQLGVGTLHISELEKRYVNEALNNNRLSYGPFSRKFESEFAKAHNSAHAVLSNSGTSALQTALAALMERHNWQEGDEVIVPAVTFIATSNVVLMLGLKPVFVDVDQQTYNIDPALIEEKITGKTKAIIPVHLFGLPADMKPIMAIARKHNLRVVEDSCETMFVKAYGKPVGSHGDIGCFSTYVAHFLVTGVGGLAITDDDELAVTMRSLCNHGRDGIYLAIDDDDNKSSKELSMIVKRRFNFVRMGYSYRVTELEAALGVAQMEIKDGILETRVEHANYLINGLRPLEKAGHIQLASVPDYAEHAFMLFPIVVQDKQTKRDDLTLFLEEHMIETRPMMPLINQPFYKEIFGDIENQYPVAKWINNGGFYIGCHQGFGREELDYIIKTFHDFFAG
ncbi:MAG TPA: DegT/DnrJ/EryC1/StrS family aminotransferase [Candidatus Polarisedimenticolaceae bacterium]|nr:DegT/DnrJ/EryC1/StrS family aminotransferase [Candidatus Polarisedimenticolaceae bacterium]